MLQLTLIRHAKSDWGDRSVADFDRPLNESGLRAAPVMGKALLKHAVNFDSLFASPALRAITTAELIATELGYSADNIQTVDELYNASLATLVAFIRDLNVNTRRIAIVAHNPGMNELCKYFCSESVGDLPTCAVMVIEFDLDTWEAVSRHSGHPALYDYPRNHEH